MEYLFKCNTSIYESRNKSEVKSMNMKKIFAGVGVSAMALGLGAGLVPVQEAQAGPIVLKSDPLPKNSTIRDDSYQNLTIIVDDD